MDTEKEQRISAEKRENKKKKKRKSKKRKERSAWAVRLSRFLCFVALKTAEVLNFSFLQRCTKKEERKKDERSKTAEVFNAKKKKKSQTSAVQIGKGQ